MEDVTIGPDVKLPYTLASGEVLTEESIARIVEEVDDAMDAGRGTWSVPGPGPGGRPPLDQLITGASPLVNFRIPRTLHEAVQARAEAEGVTLSDIGRVALERYVKSKPRVRTATAARTVTTKARAPRTPRKPQPA